MTVARNLSLLSPNVSTSGTVNNAGLTNSSITINGTAVSLGGTGTLAVTPSNFASQTANTVLAAPNGSAGTPTFRALVAADIPALTLENLPDAWAKRSARVATTANITLSGTQTIDGIAVVAGDRVLVKDQTTASQNGIYVVAAGAWARSADANLAGELGAAQIGVDSGTANGGLTFDTDFKTTDTLGTTAMTWSRVLDAAYLTTVGNSLATLTNPGAITFLQVNANNTVSALTAASFRTAIGAGTSSTTGTVTGVTGTAPVVSSGGTAPAISMAAATASVNGYMTNTYAAKLDGIAAGATANTGTVTSVTGTAPVASSGGTAPAISMAAATASANGYMTSTYAAKLDGIAAGATANAGTVTSVATGTGLSGGPITSTGTIALANTTVTAGSYTLASITVDAQGRITAASNGSASGGGVTSFSAGTTGLTPSTDTTGAVTLAGTLGIANGGTNATTAAAARTNLGATTLGGNLFTLTNVAAIAFPRFNADNTVSSLNAASFRTAIGAGAGTVTSVGGTGTVSGLTLTGTVTSTGNLTLGGTLAVTASNFASQTANTFLCAPSGAAGVPTFRAILAADIPTLNQSTTGSAATFTSTTQNSQFNSVGVGTAGSATAGEIRATNNITAYYSSDRKFKENVTEIKNASNIVREIGAKYFDWTDEYIAAHGGADGYFVQKQDFGVIAQDVLRVFPRAVRTRSDGSLAVDYEKLGVLAFPALVETMDKVETVTVSVVELAKRIVDQEARITHLESIILSMRK